MKSKLESTPLRNIPENWEVESLSAVCSDIIDCSHARKPTFVEKSNHIFLEVDNIGNNGFLNLSKVKYIEEQDFQAWTKRLTPNQGDIVITKTGRVGAVAMIPEGMSCCIGRNQVLLRPNPSVIVPEFLLCYLLSPMFKSELKRLALSGTILESLHVKYIPELRVPIPEKSEQQKIADALLPLYQKEIVNSQINKTLESIAQAIFKHWFVDFEFPNEEGNPYKSSGGKMVKSKLGDIPYGWFVGKIGNFGQIQPGFAFKSRDYVSRGIGLIKIRNIDKSGFVILDFESLLSQEVFERTDSKFHLHSGDVIIAMTGAELGKVGIIPEIEKTWLLNQRVGKVVSNSKYFMYLWLKSDYCQSFMTGTSSASSAQGNVSNSDIESIEIVIPTNDVIGKFNIIINTVFTKLVNNLGMNIILSQIRDSLLPKLMSGQIRLIDRSFYG